MKNNNNNNNLKDKAFKIYEEHGGNIKPGEISRILGVTPRKISNWKTNGKWDKKLGYKKNKRGAPKGNTNAVGNAGGGERNQNARKRGLHAKYHPVRLISIYDDIDKSKLTYEEILEMEIKQQLALIIDNGKMLHVKDNDDHTIVEKKVYDGEEGSSKEYEILTAYEKQLRTTEVMSGARKTLAELIKKRNDLIHKNCESVDEEQKLKIEERKLKIEKNKIENDILKKKNEEDKDKGSGRIKFVKADVNNE